LEELPILQPDDLLLVTGATGLVGSHVAQRAREMGLATRALVRSESDTTVLDRWGIEKCEGELNDADSLVRAATGATLVVHCAAKVGDWGSVDNYRFVNVIGLENLLDAIEKAGTLRHLVHVSSLDVYENRDHHGSDETVAPGTNGADAYCLTKIEAEKLVLQHVRERRLPATVVRPGLVYGPRDRTAIPRLLERLKAGHVKYFGSGEQVMHNTFVGNLVDAIFEALERPRAIGEVYNVTDGELVSKRDFISTVATMAGYDVPRSAVPLAFARLLTAASEKAYRLLRRDEAPLLSNARFNMLGRNLDFSIEKARRELGYNPQVGFRDAMRQTIDWFRTEGKL
jgi:nucleoside-diphosphate-sugar epimerase